MYEEFREIGRDLFLSGLVTSHGGNMSVRLADKVLITRRGAMLGRLGADDLVETALDADDSMAGRASTELAVHRAIYRATNVRAIVHTHPVHAIALSLFDHALFPADAEGSHLVPEVPVVVAAETVGSQEVAARLPPVLKNHRIALLRGHGAFAVGQTLEEAYMLSSTLEASAQILCLACTLGEDFAGNSRQAAERCDHRQRHPK